MKDPNEQMILLIDILKDLGIIKFDTDFCEAIGLRKQNLYNIRKGKNKFTPDHILNAIKIYNVDANWIFGITDNVFMENRVQTRVQNDLKPQPK